MLIDEAHYLGDPPPARALTPVGAPPDDRHEEVRVVPGPLDLEIRSSPDGVAECDQELTQDRDGLLFAWTETANGASKVRTARAALR